MFYAQFYAKNLANEVAPMLGSDSVLHLDGRKSLNNMRTDAKIHAFKLNKNLNKGIVGFTIRRGDSYTTSREIASLVKVDAEG